MIVSSTILNTQFGDFKVAYHEVGKNFCVSLSCGDIHRPGSIIRLHSSCLFSEALHSIDCDCDLQLSKAMEIIAKESQGVVIYLYQEGRGLGLANKIKAMEVQRIKHMDTVDAFKSLHFDLDPRRYGIAIKALKELGVNEHIRLITNNPRKRKQLEKGGFIVDGKVGITYPVNKIVREYLKSKREKLGHEIEEKFLSERFKLPFSR